MIMKNKVVLPVLYIIFRYSLQYPIPCHQKYLCAYIRILYLSHMKYLLQHYDIPDDSDLNYILKQILVRIMQCIILRQSVLITNKNAPDLLS